MRRLAFLSTALLACSPDPGPPRQPNVVAVDRGAAPPDATTAADAAPIQPDASPDAAAPVDAAPPSPPDPDGGAPDATPPALDAGPPAPDAGPAIDPPAPRWQLAWHDEFDGPAGPLDPARWTHDVGGHGWGNDQLEFNTDRVTNSAIDGAGHLVITARREDFGGRQYTSARVLTRDRFAQAYGRFEARIRLPIGQGIWPAFWMLGADFPAVGWPACGEIDIMEFRGQHPFESTVALHGPGYSAGEALYAVAPSATRLPDDFHLFAVEWDPAEIRWFVDEREVFRVTPADLPPGTQWVYDHPFFLILNIAVGGRFLGDPDASTRFPQQMLVDWVRVWHDPSVEPPAPRQNPLAPDGPDQRLTVGIFREGAGDRAVPIDDQSTHFYLYEGTVGIEDSRDAVEGALSTALVHRGGEWWGAGVHWDSARDLADWTVLHLRLKALNPAFASTTIRMMSIGDRSTALPASRYGFQADGAWHTVEIPLADFVDVEPSAIVAPLVFGGGPAPAGGGLLVDDVYFSNRAR